MHTFTLDAPIDTARLRLRSLEATDAEQVHAYQSDPDVTTFMPYGPRSLAEVVEKIGAHSPRIRLAEDKDYLMLAVERRDTGRVIGELYFSLLSVENNGAEIGWALNPDSQGAGYVTEAAGAVLDLAFGELGLHRVEAHVDPRNDASAAVCGRLGMRHEGTLIENALLLGEYCDTAIFALLDRDWATTRSGEPS
ncbi:GNAT family protein [Klugiella xanthotipulae]|uniref:RimJ/RimL family protein N-acetyltransferase n=1 Tax=Klugiella xanthotipulae TaxID=244735 RepID=A0A543I4J6_9MICO|nr:GNAT family protein [Klugiella xanthotipulae]TQM65505.1 RimJ/RimL family protein N-acetyltransferase [Klugiella xanthotipulae]